MEEDGVIEKMRVDTTIMMVDVEDLAKFWNDFNTKACQKLDPTNNNSAATTPTVPANGGKTR